MINPLIIFPPAPIIVSNILSVIVVFCYLGILAVIAYFEARRQRATGLPSPLRTISHSRDYILGAFAACNVFFMLDKPLYAIAPVLFTTVTKKQLIVWNFISNIGWATFLRTMRPHAFRHLITPVLGVHALVFHVAWMWRYYRAKIAELGLDNVSTGAVDFLPPSPVALASNMCILVACCYFGIYGILSCLGRTRRQDAVSEVDSPILPFTRTWPAFARFCAIYVTTLLSWNFIGYVASTTDNTLLELVALCVSGLAWCIMILRGAPYLYNYLGPAVITVHLGVAWTLLWQKCPSIRLEDLGNTSSGTLVGIVLLLILVAFVVLINQLSDNLHQHGSLSQHARGSYGTFSRSTFLVVSDVEAALPRTRGLSVDDEVSPFSTVANNTSRPLRNSESHCDQPGEASSVTHLATIGDGTSGHEQERFHDPEDHSGSSAATAIYVGPPPKVKYQDESSDVLDVEEAERVDTPVGASHISTSYVRDVVAAFNKASSQQDDTVSAQTTVEHTQSSLSETFEAESARTNALVAEIDPTPDWTVPMDELSVTCTPSTRTQEQYVSTAGTDTGAPKPAVFFKRTRSKPRPRIVSGKSSSSTTTNPPANAGSSSKIPVAQIPKLRRGKAKSRRHEARSEPAGGETFEQGAKQGAKQDENIKQRQVSAPAKPADLRGSESTSTASVDQKERGPSLSSVS